MSHVVRRFFKDVLNNQDEKAAGHLVDPAVVVHHPMLPGGNGTFADVMKLMTEFRKGFPDLVYTVEDLVGENDKVAARWRARGTHRGEFNGRAATERQVTVTGTDIFAIVNDRIVEVWICSDLLGLMRQIGAIS